MRSKKSQARRLRIIDMLNHGKSKKEIAEIERINPRSISMMTSLVIDQSCVKTGVISTHDIATKLGVSHQCVTQSVTNSLRKLWKGALYNVGRS